MPTRLLLHAASWLDENQSCDASRELSELNVIAIPVFSHGRREMTDGIVRYWPVGCALTYSLELLHSLFIVSSSVSIIVKLTYLLVATLSTCNSSCQFFHLWSGRIQELSDINYFKLFLFLNLRLIYFILHTFIRLFQSTNDLKICNIAFPMVLCRGYAIAA